MSQKPLSPNASMANICMASGSKRRPAPSVTPWSRDLNHDDDDNDHDDDQTEPFIRLNSGQPATFPVNERINSKIALWRGNMLRLDVDAMVHPTNERFERASPLTNALYQESGQELLKCLYNKIKYCPNGSIAITKGYNIGPQYIIHTASPHYKYKFHTACETVLFNCYIKVLQACVQYNFRTLALGSIALPRHNYPEVDGVHLGVRVIRRFLESHHDSFDLIVLCVEDQYQYDLYRSVLRLYFPRTPAEETLQCYLLPANTGGPMGEPLIPERAIRIQENPIKNLMMRIEDSGLESDLSYNSCSSVESETQNNSSRNIDECRERLNQLNYQQEFEDMETETRRRQRQLLNNRNRTSSMTIGGDVSSSPSPSETATIDDHYGSTDQLLLDEHKRILKFERLLRKTRRMEKELPEEVRTRITGAVFESGRDSQDRSVLTIIGHELAAVLVDANVNGVSGAAPVQDYVLAHLLRQLDKVSRRDYIILYFHTGVDGHHQLSRTALLSRLYEYIRYQHRKTLRFFYIVHPSVWNRLYVWWMKTFWCLKFLRNKVIFIHQIGQLENLLGVDNYQRYLRSLPAFIKDHDNHGHHSTSLVSK